MCRTQCPSTKLMPCLTPSFWPAVIVWNSKTTAERGRLEWSPVKVMEKMALCPASRASSEQHASERAILGWSIMLQFFVLFLALRCTLTYELPDGNSITFGAKHLRRGGMSFQPHSTGNEASGSTTLPSSVMKCDVDIRKVSYTNVVCSAARPCFNEISEFSSVSSTRVKVPDTDLHAICAVRRHCHVPKEPDGVGSAHDENLFCL